MNGLDATRQILKDNPQVEVLILTMLESEQLVRQVFASGARGYLLKSDAGNELLAAVDTVRQHKPFFTSSIAETMLRHFLESGSADVADAAGLDGLTAREREIVQLVAEGKSSKEISVILHITPKTVETHRSHIMSKLELNSVPDLVRYAIRNHIIEC
jgi:DNA-binding NarL/FixJ family response regulator